MGSRTSTPRHYAYLAGENKTTMGMEPIDTDNLLEALDDDLILHSPHYIWHRLRMVGLLDNDITEQIEREL